MSLTFFTIVATNYLAQARTLGESVLAHHPGSRFVIWLLDDNPALLEKQPFAPLELRAVEGIFSHSAWGELILRYDILELATAVKPRCMQSLFEEGAEQVFYIDPDIVFFRPLKEALEMMEAGAMGVLIPHLLAPLPRDGALPDDRYILRSGIYNLGFLALSAGEESDALLAWWGEWLKTDCYRDPCKGVFVDQKWMDFAPIFWPRMGILRDETYNVAYWNLPHRKIERRGETWYVNGRPLTFFHFSGFDPERPGILSKHQNRIAVKPWTDLAKLLKWYADTLKAHDYATYARVPVPLPRFDNGVPVDPVVRRLFQQALEEGMRFPDPLAAG
ncbi:MAG: hypothetical protein D6819_07300, partial [Gammaproteobacteria bacterium]